MPWLRTGTVACTLNSTTVTGTGTGFVANARVGDAFLGPDGRWYEVANIASDTALSILPAYLGATVSAGSYALAPMQGYVKDSADQLRTLVNKFGTLAAAASINALAALTGTAGQFPYFIAVDQMALANLADYAKSGQNSDIKALTGLTTALTAAQGGTGVTSIASLLTALNALGNFARTNIVGTVSQSGGIPTGAIIETGSNTNGTYIKWADGSMCCFRQPSSATVTPAASSAFGSVYAGAAFNMTFPATFIAAPSVNWTGVAVTVTVGWHGFEGAASTTTTNLIRWISPAANATGWVGYVAWGRWF